MPELFSSELRSYLDELVPPRPIEMQAMEEHARATAFPIIGPAAGQFCYTIARLMGARRIFEMGSGYGYSTAWFARAVVENGGGVVHHVVWDEALSRRSVEHLRKLGYSETVQFHIAEATATLRDMPEQFDIIFNDIDKHAYPESLAVVKDKLRAGGVLIIDNMLWSGRIFDEEDQSPATAGVREFTRRITNDAEWIVTLVPIRDGLILAYKAGRRS